MASPSEGRLFCPSERGSEPEAGVRDEGVGCIRGLTSCVYARASHKSQQLIKSKSVARSELESSVAAKKSASSFFFLGSLPDFGSDARAAWLSLSVRQLGLTRRPALSGSLPQHRARRSIHMAIHTLTFSKHI